MNTDLSHLPEHKQEEAAHIVRIIRKAAKVDMVILYGSHARGDWVEEAYVEDDIVYEYASDIDILVIVGTEKRAKDFKLWQQVRSQLAREPGIHDRVSLIIEHIDAVNAELQTGRYFFGDIKREGIALYDSGKVTLAEAANITPEERQQKSKEDLYQWLENAADHRKNVEFNKTEGMLNLAAFHLHQVAECVLIGYLLVRTGYRPKTHDIEYLMRISSRYDNQFHTVIPRQTEADEQLFDLLRLAYVDARYKKTYEITSQQIEDLIEHTESLEMLVRAGCAIAIEQMA